MHYEHFSRHLREKYSTRLHLLDQLVDHLKQKNQPSKRDRPNIAEPYLNECILVAERMKNHRRSNRDRQICYENLILAEKLERIRKQSGENCRENLEKDYQNHCRLFPLKSTNDQQTIKTITQRFLTKSSREEISSPSPIYSEGDLSYEDDQATAADVDVSMNSEYIKSIPSVNIDRAYQHLTNIDMTMIRNRSPVPPKHFSISILPSRRSIPDRQYAFKKEIFYH